MVKKFICKTCHCKTNSLGHLCDPKKVTKTALKKLMQEFNMTAAEIQDLIKGDKDGGGESL